MAKTHGQYGCRNNMIFSPGNIDVSLIKLLNDKEDLIYDGERMKWTQKLCSLEKLVWSGKCSWFGRVMEIVRWELIKQFTSVNLDLTITWHPGKQNSIFLCGRSGDLLKQFLISTLNTFTNCHDTTNDNFSAISEDYDKSRETDLDSRSSSQETQTVCTGNESVSLDQVNSAHKSMGKCFVEDHFRG